MICIFTATFFSPGDEDFLHSTIGPKINCHQYNVISVLNNTPVGKKLLNTADISVTNTSKYQAGSMH